MWDEHVRLAQYLKERFLTIDVYDANSRFLWATTKIPLFELMRQGSPSIQKVKTVELCAPDSSEFRGSIDLVINNDGHKEKNELVYK